MFLIQLSRKTSWGLVDLNGLAHAVCIRGRGKRRGQVERTHVHHHCWGYVLQEQGAGDEGREGGREGEVTLVALGEVYMSYTSRPFLCAFTQPVTCHHFFHCFYTFPCFKLPLLPPPLTPPYPSTPTPPHTYPCSTLPSSHLPLLTPTLAPHYPPHTYPSSHLPLLHTTPPHTYPCSTLPSSHLHFLLPTLLTPSLHLWYASPHHKL